MNPVIDGILMTEGSYTNNPHDRGGATNWGITEATARANGYQGDMRDMTRAEAYSILENDYWVKPGFELISQISWPVAFELCDAAVNIGPRLPCLWLQRWLNALNREQKNYQDIKVDGHIGPMTIAALQVFIAWRGREGEHVLVEALNCSQGAYYLNITEERPQNEDFIYGWIKNRVT
ncbi:glycoside hydrolase family 108 protein [Superficieibacter sp. HKU1]|uniref:glycoside hydrolase family 108 protein n=1 Tax=Superficieibacter sp. HKU1 TaxID=3031919 RepID=UPI0023E1DAA0|nr:glycoside hydrolase family 108 protein [Superficieibacter sp. HKU1]WES69217.1 glycoside hydrolase family 108 protein [Superficieibacter sp. HKU1]